MVVGNFPLAGKIVVITGGGSGINLEFAKLCHQRQSKVIIGDIKLTPEAEKWLQTVKDGSVKFQKTDVTKWDQLQSLVTVSEQEYGDVPDVYVAGAGIFEPVWSNFWQDTEQDHYTTVDVNVSHPIKFTRIAIRQLLQKNKKGVILIVASIAGQAPNLTAPLYVATKHAVCGFTRSLEDLDEKLGIKVVASSPGMVYTRLWTERPQDVENYSIKPENCLMPEEVAESMVELTESSKWPGGTVLEVAKGSGLRSVPAFNAPPPAGMGTKPKQSVAETVIYDLLEQERRGAR